MGLATVPLVVYSIEARTFGAAAVLAGLLLGLVLATGQQGNPGRLFGRPRYNAFLCPGDRSPS